MTEREFLSQYSHGWSWDVLKQRYNSIWDPILNTEVERCVTLIGWRVDGIAITMEIFQEGTGNPLRRRGWVKVGAPYPPLTWRVVRITGKNPPPGNKQYRFESPYIVLAWNRAYGSRFDPKQATNDPTKRVRSDFYSMRVPATYFDDPATSHEVQRDVADVVRRVRAEYEADLQEAMQAFEKK